jgi:hypothetical protein
VSSKPAAAALDRRPWGTSSPAALERISDYRTLRDFRAFEIVNALRLSLALQSFRALVALASIALVVVGTLAFVSAMSVLRDGPFRHDSAVVLVWGLLAFLYSTAALVFSEIVSSRRLAVSGTPHLELFRAMELPFRQVVVRYGLVPMFRRMAVLWYSAAAFLAIFFETTANYSNVVAASLCILALASAACLYSVLHFASAPAQRTSLRWPSCVLTLMLGLVLGAATGTLSSRLGPAGIAVGEVPGYLPLISLSALAAAMLLLLMSIRKWRSLGYRRVLLTAQRSGRRSPSAGLTKFLLFDLLGSQQGSVAGTIILAWIAVVGFLLGANGVLPLTMSVNSQELQRSLIGLTVLLSLGIIEPMLHRIGPTAKLYHFRFAWENGSSARGMVASLLWVYFLVGGIVGAFIFCCAFLAVGVPAPGTVLAGMVVTASGIIAETLARPPVSTDGTKSNDVMDALFMLLLVSPCSLTLVLSPEHGALLLFGYTILLTLGAAACLRTHLLKLRSRSKA